MVDVDNLSRQLLEAERLRHSARRMVYRAARKGGDIEISDIARRLMARNEGLAYEDAREIAMEAAKSYAEGSRFSRRTRRGENEKSEN